MRRRGQNPVWLWPSLLSLDAPAVALVWQDFLARCCHLPLQPATRIALGLTVWAIYLSDRLLDVRQPKAGLETTRHSFNRRHRRPIRIMLASVLLTDLLVALQWLCFAMLKKGLLIAVAILFYFVAFPLGRMGSPVIKKMMAGILFTAGVFLIAANRLPVWPMASFCALCIGNLLLVEHWHQHENSVRGWIWMAALSVICLPVNSPWFRAVAVSAAALAVLSFQTDTIHLDARCILADAVLLSPLLFR